MTSTANEQAANDLLNGGGGPAGFKFESIGDTAKGSITNLTTQQARDFKTQKPKTYEDGNPIMQIVITLRQDDDEETRVFVKPAMKAAIRDAVATSGADGLSVGGRLAVRYTADEPPEQPGLNPKKLFTAQYEPPNTTVKADELL